MFASQFRFATASIALRFCATPRTRSDGNVLNDLGKVG